MRLTKANPLCWAEYWDGGQGPNVFPLHILLEDLIHTVTTQEEIEIPSFLLCCSLASAREPGLLSLSLTTEKKLQRQTESKGVSAQKKEGNRHARYSGP